MDDAHVRVGPIAARASAGATVAQVGVSAESVTHYVDLLHALSTIAAEEVS